MAAKVKKPAQAQPDNPETLTPVTPITEPQPAVELNPNPPKELHHSDLSRIEILSRDVQNRKLLMAVEEQALRNLTLELEITQRKIDSQKQLIQRRHQEYVSVQSGYDGYVRSLLPKYGIKPNASLSYNPETGEIVRD